MLRYVLLFSLMRSLYLVDVFDIILLCYDLGLIRTDVWFAALLSYNELTEISFVLHVFCRVVYFAWYLCVILNRLAMFAGEYGVC